MWPWEVSRLDRAMRALGGRGTGLRLLVWGRRRGGSWPTGACSGTSGTVRSDICPRAAPSAGSQVRHAFPHPPGRGSPPAGSLCGLGAQGTVAETLWGAECGGVCGSRASPGSRVLGVQRSCAPQHPHPLSTALGASFPSGSTRVFLAQELGAAWLPGWLPRGFN